MTQLRFGLQPPENAIRAWGARAILEMGRGNTGVPTFSLLGDRQDSFGIKLDPADRAFRAWVDDVALPWLRGEIKRRGVQTMDEVDLVRASDASGRYMLRANPRASGGYLYIVAYETAPAASDG